MKGAGLKSANHKKIDKSFISTKRKIIGKNSSLTEVKDTNWEKEKNKDVACLCLVFYGEYVNSFVVFSPKNLQSMLKSSGAGGTVQP